MFRALQVFLKSDAPTRAQAAGALRLLFVVAFWGQSLLAALAWVVLSTFLTPQPAVTTLTAQVLVGLGALELPVAYALGSWTARGGTQAGALSAALLEGILLAAPVWFALFTWLIGSPTLYPGPAARVGRAFLRPRPVSGRALRGAGDTNRDAEGTDGCITMKL